MRSSLCYKRTQVSLWLVLETTFPFSSLSRCNTVPREGRSPGSHQTKMCQTTAKNPDSPSLILLEPEAVVYPCSPDASMESGTSDGPGLCFPFSEEDLFSNHLSSSPHTWLRHKLYSLNSPGRASHFLPIWTCSSPIPTVIDLYSEKVFQHTCGFLLSPSITYSGQ